MSVIHEQSMLLASCCSEQDIQYLENFLKNSLENTPLKQISGNVNQQNPEYSRQTQLVCKEQNLNKTQSDPKQIKSQLFEEAVQSKHQICIISFRDRQTNQELNLRKQSSFFECFGCGDTYVACRYRFRGESSFEIFIHHQKQLRQQLIFCINFNTINAQIKCDQQNQLIYFEILTKRHYLTFSAQPSEASHLKKIFQNIEKNNLGKQIDLCDLQIRPEYYRQRYDTEQYFVNNCQTGDILLFQDNHFAAKVQRFITGSNFDHVGMVVKDPHYGILIFESNSNSGVCLTLWKSVISNRWYKLIPKISWRRLTKINRNFAFQAKIKKFLMQNLQKSFHIGSRVITANQSVIIADEKNNNMEKASGFFCSELIATLYKNLGLLTRDRQNPNYQPACKFYPKDFSELSNRQLDKGELSPESQIYFDPKLLCRNYPDLKFEN